MTGLKRTVWNDKLHAVRQMSSTALKLMNLLLISFLSLCRRKKAYSVRKYDTFVVASVDMGSSPGPADRTAAFRGLASYLFGSNEEGAKMEMTTPVFSSNRRMQFVLPVQSTTQAPTPETGSQVKLEQVYCDSLGRAVQNA